MVSSLSPSRLFAAALQYSVGLLLLPLEPQYGVLVLGHHVVVEPLRSITPAERVYVACAIAFHVVGVAFAEHLYRALWWYDDVAHLLSGSLVAGLLAVVLSRRVADRCRVAAGTMAALALVALAWEMYEFHTPRLTVYGWGDSASDVAFGLVGGAAMLGYLAVRERPSGAGARLPGRDAQ